MNHDQVKRSAQPDRGLRGGESRKLTQYYEQVFLYISRNTVESTKILETGIRSVAHRLEDVKIALLELDTK